MKRIANISAIASLCFAACCGVRAFAASVVINEFMASNGSTITNALGVTADWVELFNVSSNAVNLQGWYLTDNANNLTKWQFPSVVLPAGGYRLVYADDKPDKWINGELHTSFQLSSGGEYLALVRPNGATAESEYAPAFPPQSEDVAYGLRPEPEATEVIAEAGGYRFHIPSDDSAGTNWVSRTGFDDSAWSAGAGALGYEVGYTNFPGLILTQVPIGTTGVYVRYSFQIPDALQVTSLKLGLRYDDGFVAYVNGKRVLAAAAPIPPAWNSGALGERDNADAAAFEDLDLAASIPLLRNGTNVLAVHVMNVSGDPAGSDLLLGLKLVAERTVPSPSGEKRYFHKPTPGRANVLGEADFLRPVQFSHRRGFYDTPFALTLSANLPEYEIRYTLNGYDPALVTPLIYTGQIQIAATTVVRARAFRAGYEPSPVEAHSFLFPQDIIRQSTMSQTVVNDPAVGPQVLASLRTFPTLSFSSGYDNIFGTAKGIYANPTQRGELWERPCSFEWIDPLKGTNVHAAAGVRIYGGASRGNAKKSFRFLFKARYGDTKLRYRLFDDPTATDAFDTLIFRAGSNDPFTSNGLRDPFVRRTLLATGQQGSRAAFAHVFVDGKYWGLYNPSERCDQGFAASYYDMEKTDWDGINAGYPINESDQVTWSAMLASVSGSTRDVASFQRMMGNNPDGTRNPSYVVHLDVVNHIDYMMTQIFAGTTDWPQQNWYAGGASTNSTGWKFFTWDAEFSLESLTKNNSGTAGPMSIHGTLKLSPEYRLMFADRVRKHFFDGGAMSPEATIPRYQELVEACRGGVAANAARWGAVSTVATWQNSQANMLNAILPQRTSVVLGQFRAGALYPAIEAPTFSQYGGFVPEGFALSISAAYPVFYTTDGTDPREIGTGGVRGQTYRGPITIGTNMRVKARAMAPGGVWSALTEAFFVSEACYRVRVTELMVAPYAPPAGAPYVAADYEFIEVANIGSSAINLQYMAFTEGVDFEFPSFTLAGGEHAVVVGNMGAFLSRYPASGIRIAGVYSGSLNNGGERVTLRAARGDAKIVSFEYADGRAWPFAAQGAGHSLVPVDPSGPDGSGLDDAGHWRASAYRGGSPGVADPQPLVSVLLNEFAAHTDYTNEPMSQYESNDWIELFNTSADGVPLNHWYLSDDPDRLTKWAIPSAESIVGRGWKVFDEITGFHNPTNTGFGLSKGGEQVLLSYLPGNGTDRVADAIKYKGQDNGVTLGRYRDGEPHWFALPPTRGTANGVPLNGVVITEIMYHPRPTALHPEDNTHDEYVEILNPTGEPVPLWTSAGSWRLTGGVDYTLPPGVTLPAGGRILFVPFDPADTNELDAFKSAYGLSDIQSGLLGPYAGQLANDGERVALERPMDPDLPLDPVIWVVVDEVSYSDQSPWPASADGEGDALQRFAGEALSSMDPGTWSAVYGASPGEPPPRLAVVHPRRGDAFFAPLDLALQVRIDEGVITSSTARVIYRVDGEISAVATQAPYGAVLTGYSDIGPHEVVAELEGGGPAGLSRSVAFHTLRIGNAGGADRVGDFGAVLRAEVMGGVAADIFIHWGEQDGMTNAEAWARSAYAGRRTDGGISVEVNDFLPGRRYFYRAFGKSGANSGWAPASSELVTRTFGEWPRHLRVGFPDYGGTVALSNFPALVRLGPSLPGFSYADFTSPAGEDLRFSDEDGEPVAFEVEAWDPGGTSLIWVRVPRLQGTNTYVLAHWGLEGAEAPPYTRNGETWSEGFFAVWHWGDGLRDSAALHGTDALNAGSVVDAGIVGNARLFDGQNDYIDPAVYRGWYGGNIGGLTITAWARPVSGNIGGVFGVSDAALNDRLYMRPGRGNWVFAAKQREATVGAVKTDQWQMLTLVLNTNRMYGWIDGNPGVNLGSYSDFIPRADCYIGVMNGDLNHFAGLIDEFRMSSVPRSEAWIRAEYRTVAEHAQFTAYVPLPTGLGDADGDRLPDAWERYYYGRIGATPGGDCDSDGDGHSDYGELVAGTHPLDDEDAFRLYLEGSPGAPLLWFSTVVPAGEWESGLRRFYSLEQVGRLIGGSWEGVPVYTGLTASGSTVIYSIPSATNGPGYYRGRVWLAP